MKQKKNPFVVDAHIHLSAGREGLNFTAKTMIEKMDEAGVDACMSMGSGGNPFEKLQQSNDFNLQSGLDYPKRIFPFIYFDPRYEEDGLVEIDRCMEKGKGIFKGIKVGHEYAVARYMYPMMEKAQEYKLPVGIHSDHSVRGNPYVIGDLANSFPKVPTIILHMGGRTAASAETVAVTVAKKNKNVWLETCFSNPFPIKLAVDKIGPDRIMFGSDSSNSSVGYGAGYERQAYEMMTHALSIQYLDLPKDQEDKLMGLNAARLFGLEVK